jgi:ApaG protein
MSTQQSVQPRFEVIVKTTYSPSESKPEQSYHFFSYRITIKNSGTTPAQLVSRHWIITDALGRVEEVRGPGVVGLQPRIQGGQSFEYESGCPLNTSSGSMKGSYEMVGDNGEKFSVEIPEFYLIAPSALH